MAFYRPLLRPTPLPSIGAMNSEKEVLDWKANPVESSFERAKDVAAFANHLGGTLLVGAVENRETGQLVAYRWMSLSEVARIRKEYENAVEGKCQPRPAFDFEEFEDPSDPERRVLAINVSPSLDLVGVKLQGDKAVEGWNGEVYAYPVRLATRTMFLAPGELAMYLTPAVRRIAVMLSMIPGGAFVTVFYIGAGHNYRARFVDVDESRNLARVMNTEGGYIRLPLDRIRTVFESGPTEWTLSIESFT